jgi:hypothetical protein
MVLLHLLSRGSTDMSALLAEVTRAWEAVAAVEATHITTILAVEISAHEAAAAQDSAALRIEDVEDRAALAEREAWERVSRVDAENAMVLASTREHVECYTPFRDSGNEASIRVPRMFHSHV